MSNLDLKSTRIQKLATFAPFELGDTILATPLYKALRAAYPQVHFTVLSQLPNHPVLEGFNTFDSILNYDPEADLSRQYDLVVLPVLCGDAEVRQHFARHSNVISADRLHADKRRSLVNKWNGKYSHVLFYKHQVEMNMELAYEAGYAGQTIPPYCPQSDPSEYETQRGKIGLFINTPINEFQAMANRQWPMKHWSDLIDRLGVANVLLAGGVGDRPNVERLADLTGAPFVVTKSLAEFTALCRALRLLVTTDGGAMHAAATAGVSIVSLHGTSSPILLHPWIYPEGKCISVLSLNTCSPCQRSFRLQVCEGGLTAMNCMQNIRVESVERAIAEIQEIDTGTCLIMKGDHLMTKKAYLKSWKRKIGFALNYNMARTMITITPRARQNSSAGWHDLPENSKAGS